MIGWGFDISQRLVLMAYYFGLDTLKHTFEYCHYTARSLLNRHCVTVFVLITTEFVLPIDSVYASCEACVDLHGK